MLTSSITTILNRQLDELTTLISQLEASQRILAFTIYDWLAHLTDRSYIWNQYGSSLKNIVCEKTIDMPYPVLFWMSQVMGSPLSTDGLIYRHHLMKSVTDEEIGVESYQPSLYILIASMMTTSCVFAPLDSMSVWDDINTHPQPINLFRERHPYLKQSLYRLAMREDITSDQTVVDHGLLSSFSLLYGYHLAYVMLIYQTQIRPDKSLTCVVESLSNTLTQLKGVFNNVH